ncbi:Pantoate-beta-alanine ligase [Mycena floridula]|nr:Pantoate-beta-alanine ligase [Mycena floridula]
MIRCFAVRSMSTQLPSSSIPIFTSVKAFREWRHQAFSDRKSVGFVPTMGALHAGHISLVQESLAQNDLTVLSIFVNPAQFAPHEDLTTYPRTLVHDLELLEAQKIASRNVSAVFLPTVQEMYPSGISQDVTSQLGTFVEVKGYGDQMEGKSRPTFFRGVATVVTKLFNAIQPTNAYFGQKDIQQGLLLRRMSRDLLLSHPDADHLHIVQTARDESDNLALSSRNAYLSNTGRAVAPTLFKALTAAQKAWNSGRTKAECVQCAMDVVEEMRLQIKAQNLPVVMKMDYISFNYSSSFQEVEDETSRKAGSEPVILSGALWVDKTRLIDNLILGPSGEILC